jgi:hypothetical protein
MTADLLAAAGLVRERNRSVQVARPMFQVLPDDAQNCACHAMRDGLLCVAEHYTMRVDAAEYDRPDRRWL